MFPQASFNTSVGVQGLLNPFPLSLADFVLSKSECKKSEEKQELLIIKSLLKQVLKAPCVFAGVAASLATVSSTVYPECKKSEEKQELLIVTSESQYLVLQGLLGPFPQSLAEFVLSKSGCTKSEEKQELLITKL